MSTQSPINRLIQLTDDLTRDQQRVVTAISGLTLNRFEYPTKPTSYLFDASLCFIAQGKKQLILGDEAYCYDKDHFLFTAIDLPVISNIIEASPQSPYLGIVLKLDPFVILQLMLEANIPLKESTNGKKGVAVGRVTPEMTDAFCRLLNLLNTPNDISVMAPLIIKEIFYRLLNTPQGERLKRIVTTGTAGHRIIEAIDWLKHHYSETLSIDNLAKMVGMSASSFHQHFKDITSMSPLQYQKRIRLSEARQLLVTEYSDISSTSSKVGYESASQFSREYKRFFGSSPSEDIRNLRM